MRSPFSSGHRRLSVLILPVVLVAGCSAADSATSQGGSGAAAASVSPTTVTSPSATGTPAGDPTQWSDQQLAAELVFSAESSASLPRAGEWARAGVGGLLLLFPEPQRDLQEQLQRIRQQSPDSRLLIGSDEEGGLVQRLESLAGALPSAETIGKTMSPTQAQNLALTYGQKMKALGVNVSFAPDADVAVPGSFIANDHRSFSTDPKKAATFVSAWVEGLRRAGVMGVLKHWPGHGSVKADTHQASAQTPPWSKLQAKDLIPFTAGLAAGACAVMVGHLIVPGLTEAGVPASMSPKAMQELRRRTGPGRLIITDSLSMAAVTSELNQSQAQAAVRSLRAGVDMAIVNTAPGTSTPSLAPVLTAVTDAITSGTLPRDQAISSARRVLTASQQWAMGAGAGPRCS